MSRGFPGQEGPIDLDGTKKPVEWIQDARRLWKSGLGKAPGNSLGGAPAGTPAGVALPLEGSSRLQRDTVLSCSATSLVAICCGGSGR